MLMHRKTCLIPILLNKFNEIFTDISKNIALILPQFHSQHMLRCFQYCKFGNFRENFVLANSVRGHICDIKNLLLVHDLPISAIE